MKTWKISMLIFVLSIIAKGQEVIVIDQENNPVSKVAAFNSSKTKSSLSNSEGIINLSRFLNQDTIFFQHPSYNTAYIKKNNISKFIYLTRTTTTLESVELIETKNNHNIKNVAEKKIYITSNDIKELNSSTTADLLEKKGGVSVQKSQGGGGSPNIRGFEANKVLLMLDGVRLNNAIYRSGHLQNIISVDEYSLEDIEIIFGPSSVLYGSDALGGTIHLKTKKLYFRDSPTWKNGLLTSYQSAHNSFKNNLFTSYESKKYSFITSVSMKKFGNVEMGQFRPHGYDDWGLVHHYVDEHNGVVCNPDPNTQMGTEYDQYDILNKIMFKLNNTWRVISNVQYSTTSNIPRFDKLNDGDTACSIDSTGQCHSLENLKFHSYYYGPQKRFFSSLKIIGFDHYLDKSEIILAYQNIKESRHKWYLDDYMDFINNPENPNYDPLCSQNESVEIYSLNTNMKKGSFNFGSELIYNKVSSTSNNNTENNWGIGDTRYPPNGSSLLSGAYYVNSFQRISNKIHIDGGLRYTFSTLKGAYPDSLNRPLPDIEGLNLTSTNQIMSGNIKLLYYPSESWKISSVTSRGFHIPNIDDMLKVFRKGDNITIPNIDLKPEYSMSQEISITKNITNKVSLYTIGFYTKLNNAIVKDSIQVNRNPDPNGEPLLASMIEYDDDFVYTFANQNSSDPIIIYGFTTGFNIKLQSFELKGDFNLTNGFNKNPSAGPVAHIPPNFGKIELRKNFKPLQVRLLYIYSGSKAADEFDEAGVDNLNETPLIQGGSSLLWAGLPSWQTLNLFVEYPISLGSVIFSVENITDRHYKTFGSGISAAGRSFNCSINLTF